MGKFPSFFCASCLLYVICGSLLTLLIPLHANLSSPKESRPTFDWQAQIALVFINLIIGIILGVCLFDPDTVCDKQTYVMLYVGFSGPAMLNLMLKNKNLPGLNLQQVPHGADSSNNRPTT